MKEKVVVRQQTEKKLKRDFSLDELVEDDDAEYDRNSAVEMFQYLEKRYKKEDEPPKRDNSTPN